MLLPAPALPSRPDQTPTRRARRSAGAAALATGALVLAGAPAATAAPTSYTLLGSRTPAVAAAPDTAAVELGMRFSASVAGRVEGVRFYKGAGNSGTHTGSIWTAGGTRLATATFTSETSSGWQYARFVEPVALTPGTTYVASYFAPNGRYAADKGFFSQPYSEGVLRATAGTYRYGGGHPVSTYLATNYHVDVRFVPATTTALPPAPTPPPPPAPTPPPAPSAFPSSVDTGVPDGTPLRASSGIVVTTPGTVLDGLDVSGSVQINASDVTLRRSRVTSGRDFALIRVKEGVTGVRIEDVTVDGRGLAGTANSMGVMGPATVVRADISGVENGFTPSSRSTLLDSWIHDLNAPGAPHLDGVQIDGGQSDVLLRHNTIDLHQWSQTAAIMIDNWFGPIDRIVVDGNRLLGAGYTVYSDGQFSGGPIRGVAFTGNRFQRGTWGYALIRNNATPPVWTGNVVDATGAPISSY